MLRFRELLTRLINHEVEFILVGGMAAAVHGSSLLTQDIDILCRMDRENITRLWHSLDGLNPQHRMARQ